MRYIRPDYYEQFQCVAGACPATCCAGWQIVIDEDTLASYKGMEGAFGNRVRNSIDWREGVFYQYENRCAFLNEEELCDLYSELGEHALCLTCRMYPRHIEEFEELREYSLSLSCPIAAKMMLERTEKVSYITEETEEEESEDFEGFDFLMHVQLEGCREVLFSIIQDRTLDLTVRMQVILELAQAFQLCVEEARCFDVEELIADYEKQQQNKAWSNRAADWKCTYEKRLEELEVLEQLEILRADWKQVLGEAKEILYKQGKDAYLSILEAFHHRVGYESEQKESFEIFGEQILMFFIFTYFCGAVYDDEVYAKVAFAVFSVHWILELCMLRWKQTGSVSVEDMTEMAYRYAREVEHSDENLICLERWLSKEFRE